MQTRPAALLLCYALVTGCGGAATIDPDAAAPDGREVVVDGVTVVELGTVTSGVPVALELGPNVLGVQLVVEVIDSNGTEQVGIRSVTSPTGEAVVASFAVVGHPLPIGATGFGIASISLPQTSAASVMPIVEGAWTAVFEVPAGKPARARAYVRTTPDGEFHGGALDVRIYVPDGLTLGDPGPAHAVTAATASADPAVRARVDSFFATLSSTFQLDRGTVEFVSLPSTFRTIDDETERLAALALTTPFVDGHGVHLVWAEDVVIAGTAVWGTSAWVPGVANSSQRQLAGIVVDVASALPAAADGMTMVHELGHFLGLFHTTEMNRSIHDPIADTPECTTTTGCPDGANIMFVTFYGASGGVGVNATAQQRRVVWGSPVYRAHPAD